MLDGFGWLAVVLAFVPAAVRLPRTQSLLRHLHDPALPERMLGSRNLIAFAFSLIAAVELVLWTRLAVFTIPLLIVAFALAGWPLRRALFAETWSFASYLWFYVRLTVVIYGFWILLIASPWLTDFDGARGWVAAAVSGILLIAWNDFYAPLIRFVLRARPVTSPALVGRFRRIIEQTTVVPPRIEYVDMRGGVLVNALALPGAKQSTVLFTSSLLERLDEEEVEAIFAHEVAHLEHYHPAYLRRLRWMGWGLIIATVTIRPLVETLAPSFEEFLVAWPMVVLGYMAVVSNKRQQHETDSDLRSAALTGNPEVMVRALIKLHELMKLPRRLDPSIEVNASHPSLARRIQAIRAASGAPAVTLPESIVLTNESTTVTLHSDRLVWSEGDIASFTLAYSALDELRVDADGRNSMHLVASDPAGRKWKMRLAPEDVARAQAALNVVDARLRAVPAGVSKWGAAGRIIAMLCAIVAVTALQGAAFVVAVIAALKGDRPLLRAAGVGAVIAGLLTARDAQREFGWMLLAVGTLVLFVSWRDRRDLTSRTTWRLVTVIGLFAVLLAIPVAMSGNALELHQSARLWPGLAVMSLAFAAANWTRRSAGWIAATAIAVVVGVASLALGDTRAIDTLVNDPFLSRLSAATPAPLPAEADSRFDLPFAPQDVFLSPNALSIAAISEEDYDEYTFHVGRAGQPLVELPADTAVFVDDDRLLLMDRDRGAARVRLINVDRPEPPLWTTTVELSEASISVARDARSWQLLGVRKTGEFGRVSGSMDGAVSAPDIWAFSPTPGTGRLFPLIADGPRLIFYKATYGRIGLGLNQQWSAWLDPWRTESRFLQSDASGQHQVLHSILEVECAPAQITGDDPICWAYDGSRTHFFRLDANAALTPLAILDGRTYIDVMRSWVVAWSPRPYALHLDTGRKYEAPRGSSFFGAGDAHVAVVTTGHQSARVEVYRVNAR